MNLTPGLGAITSTFTAREIRRFLQEWGYTDLPEALTILGYKRCYRRLAEVAEYLH